MSAPLPPAFPLPADETGRVALLHSLDLLDSPPEPVFDRVTRLASRLLGVPVTLFSLVDAERQWFKSRVGTALEGTPRAISFCTHAILGEGPLVVPDALADPRFADSPLVSGEPHIRFYAGVPVRTADGHAIGTLCAMDTVPRQLDDGSLAALLDLAAIVSDEVQRREQLASARHYLRHAGDAMRATEARLRAIFELASVGIALFDPVGNWIAVNAEACAIIDYTEDELTCLSYQQITHPDDQAEDARLVRELISGRIRQYERQKRYLRRDGSTVWVHTNVSVKRDDAGNPEYFIVAVIDIDAQKRAERELAALHTELEQRVADRTRELVAVNADLTAAIARQHEAERQLRMREAELSSILEYANDAYIGIDDTGRVTAWNRQAERTFGWTAAESAGRMLHELIIPAAMRDAHVRGMARFHASGVAAVLGKRLELPAVRKDGSELTVEIRIHATDIEGHLTFSAFLHDISARKREEAQREHDIRHDPLTGLLNRRALAELLPQAQARSRRHGLGFALLFIDLDGFKAVNDRYGHEAGDELLREVARRLRDGVRRNDSVVRLAGDEFMVLLEGEAYTLAQARGVAEKLIGAVSQPMTVTGGTAKVGASIGVALFAPEDDTAPEALMREADLQMYAAKAAGRGVVRPE